MINLEERIFSGSVLVFILLFVILGFGYNSIAKIAPLVVGIPGIFLATLQLLANFRRKEAKKKSYEGNFKNILTVWLWLAYYIFLIWLVGFFIGTFLFIITFSRFFSNFSLLRSVFFGGTSTIITYLLLSLLLEFPLPKGFFFG